jgi:hypothetical protein
MLSENCLYCSFVIVEENIFIRPSLVEENIFIEPLTVLYTCNFLQRWRRNSRSLALAPHLVAQSMKQRA